MNANTFIPEHFIDDVKTYLPNHLKLDDFINACRRPLRKSIRVNTLKITVEDFIKKAEQKNWQLTPIPWCSEGFWLERPSNEEQNLALGNTDLHLSGAMYVQEASSMLPPIALKQSIQTSSTVLDMASAPGSKTSQLAALMNNQGVLVANELSSSRLKVLSATLKRMGVGNCALSHFDGVIFGNYMYECFDSILLDAPCSGEGTLRKDPYALDNWSEQHVAEISALQTTLLESALQALKPGGVVVYSTCTLNQQENQHVIATLAQRYPEQFEPISLERLFEHSARALTKEGYLHVWPHYYDSEGFFVAALRKTGASMATPKVNKRIKPFAYQAASKKQQAAIQAHFTQQFGIQLPESHSVYLKGQDYWLLPNSFLRVKDEMRFERVGIKLAEEFKQGFRTSHDAITALGPLVSKNLVELDHQQAHQYYQGKDISYPNNSQGELAVCYQGQIIGLGKWVRNKIKNGYPRELVKDKGLG